VTGDARALDYADFYLTIYDRIEVRSQNWRGGTSVARATGDKNFSAREKRLLAEVAAERAKVEAAKAEIKVRDARILELKQNKSKPNKSKIY